MAEMLSIMLGKKKKKEDMTEEELAKESEDNLNGEEITDEEQDKKLINEEIADEEAMESDDEDLPLSTEDEEEKIPKLFDKKGLKILIALRKAKK